MPRNDAPKKEGDEIAISPGEFSVGSSCHPNSWRCNFCGATNTPDQFGCVKCRNPKDRAPTDNFS